MATSNKPKKTTTTTTITKTVTTTTGTKRKKSTGISWSRLFGISQLKSKISRKTGIPLTKAGSERKRKRNFNCLNFSKKKFSL